MTFSDKIKTIDNKFERKKAQYHLWIDKLLRFQLYYQQILVSLSFLLTKTFY